MDAAISAARSGAKRTHLIYRRVLRGDACHSIRGQPGTRAGSDVLDQSDPKRILKDSSTAVKGIECLEVKLGSRDKSGRKRPIPLKGTEFQLDVDLVIGAVGQKVDHRLLKSLGWPPTRMEPRR